MTLSVNYMHDCIHHLKLYAYWQCAWHCANYLMKDVGSNSRTSHIRWVRKNQAKSANSKIKHILLQEII